MPFVYYLPGKVGANPAHLRAAGLGALLRAGDDQPETADLVGVGPDGHAGGQLWGWTDRGDALKFDPRQQTWEAAKPDSSAQLPAGRYWLGWNTAESLPGPDQLARKSSGLVEGFTLTLGDGRDWRLPNVMQLPHRWGQADDGQPVRLPTAAWEETASRALWALEQILAALRHEPTCEDDALLRYAAEMLAINYRAPFDVVLRLGLFTDENLFTAAARTTESKRIYELMEELKKKAAAPTRPG